MDMAKVNECHWLPQTFYLRGLESTPTLLHEEALQDDFSQLSAPSAA